MNNQKKTQYPVKHSQRDSKYLNYQIKTIFALFTEIKYNFDRELEKIE